MAGEIEMTIDAVRAIANRTMGTMKGKAEQSSRTFGDVDLPASAFGGWEQAKALGRHHEGAHDVFRRTLEGVVADLQTFQQNLRDTADSSERRDEEVEESLLALGRGYQHRTFESQRNYSETVAEQTGVDGVEATDLAEADGFDGDADAPEATVRQDADDAHVTEDPSGTAPVSPDGTAPEPHDGVAGRSPSGPGFA
jgi:hypothetical protein